MAEVAQDRRPSDVAHVDRQHPELKGQVPEGDELKRAEAKGHHPRSVHRWPKLSVVEKAQVYMSSTRQRAEER